LRIKASLTSATTDAAGSVGGLLVPQRDQTVLMPQRRLTVRNLLTPVNTYSNAVEYPKQTGRNNNADVVAETAAKPESDMKFTLETVPMRVIAHWTKGSRQILEDVPQLRSMIDGELIYGLAIKEETELLSGDGTGQHLEGMIPQAAAYAPVDTPADINIIDVIGLAILQASLTDIPPDGIVIHPVDWWKMRLLKDSEGRYILGDPMTVLQPVLFGLPVVPTPAMTTGKFLVGAFKAQTLYDRWDARVETGYVNDDFTKNLVTVLAEERIGFAAKQPQALIYGDFNAALSL
jgi:HK97 family phage major capsid protein